MEITVCQCLWQVEVLYTSSGQISSPVGIVIDDDGFVYVTRMYLMAELSFFVSVTFVHFLTAIEY